MRVICLSITVLAFCAAGAYGQGKDPLTGLPVIPSAETIVQGKSYGFATIGFATVGRLQKQDEGRVLCLSPHERQRQ